MDILTDKIVKTRKKQSCWGCARQFPAGAILRKVVTVDAGDFNSSYWCIVCDTLWKECGYRDDEGISQGDMKYGDLISWEELRKQIEDGKVERIGE